MTKSTNVVWHSGHVTREQREERLGQRGCVVWFTGLSGSGKSTIACEVEVKYAGGERHRPFLEKNRTHDTNIV